jgi:hypothetical protein
VLSRSGGFQAVEEGFQFRGQWRFELERLAGERMR